MNFIFYLLMFIMINLMLFMMNPMSLGLFMIIYILNINFLMGIIYYNFWFSYIMYLIFIGGLLILFIYVISLASNEMFKFELNILYFFINFMIFIIMVIFMMKLINQYSFLNSIDLMNKLILFIYNNNDIYLNISKLYNNNNFILLLILMNYLFIMLIMIVKIVNINSGTLRLKF